MNIWRPSGRVTKRGFEPSGAAGILVAGERCEDVFGGMADLLPLAGPGVLGDLRRGQYGVERRDGKAEPGFGLRDGAERIGLAQRIDNAAVETWIASSCSWSVGAASPPENQVSSVDPARRGLRVSGRRPFRRCRPPTPGQPLIAMPSVSWFPSLSFSLLTEHYQQDRAIAFECGGGLPYLSAMESRDPPDTEDLPDDVPDESLPDILGVEDVEAATEEISSGIEMHSADGGKKRRMSGPADIVRDHVTRLPSRPGVYRVLGETGGAALCRQGRGT